MRVVGLLLLPALGLLLLGAHFLYGGLLPVAVACVLLVGLLFLPQAWAARTVQVVLVLGALEWLRRAWELAGERMAAGQPYVRMLVILGAVALLTALAALVFRHRAVRARFGLDGRA